MASLPYPTLDARRFGAHLLPALTDDALCAACGVRIAFTSREGGVSNAPFDSLNLGSAVNDDLRAVERNREILLESFDAAGMPLVVPKQVHEDTLILLDDARSEAVARNTALAQEGADGLLVLVPELAGLLCFADCVPVILVSPTGHFAVVHAGWRGVMCGIAGKAARALARIDAAALCEDSAAQINVYIGPHIRQECFETGKDVHERFVGAFGPVCDAGASHVSLLEALRVDLGRAGIVPERIADAGICTVCSSDEYFSYRAANGVCGRQGAFAFRREVSCEL